MSDTLKSMRSFLIWAAAAAVCIFALSFQASAASAVSTVKNFTMGPGDYYDAEGNVISVDGRLVKKAEDIAAAAASSASKSSAAAESAAEKTESTASKAGTAVRTIITVLPDTSSKPVSGTASDTVYTFEGKQYKAGEYAGNHKLTGYSEEECGTAGTASGSRAQAKHTLAASSMFPLGTVLIIKGTEGPHKGEWDGLYVVEDRGGYKIETEGWLDIYFDTYAESSRTTADGWNYADAWIAVPVK